MERVVIIAHADADGIAAASIISAAEDVDVSDKRVHFTQPSLLYRTLGGIQPPERLYVLDLAIDRQTRDRVFLELQRLSRGGTEIVYIDHHLLTTGDLRAFKELLPSVALYHVSGLSASQLASKWVESRRQVSEAVARRIRRLATLGGIADRCVSSRSRKMRREALILDECWRADPFDNSFRRLLVQSLKEGRLPSEIPEAVDNYEKAMRLRERAVEVIESSIFYEGSLLVLTSPRVRLRGHVGPALSEVANRRGKIAVGFFCPANVDYTIVCARAPDRHRSPIHLGKILAEICAKLGRSGGGHKSAAAGRIPLGMEERFVSLLKSRVGEPSRQSPFRR